MAVKVTYKDGKEVIIEKGVGWHTGCVGYGDNFTSVLNVVEVRRKEVTNVQATTKRFSKKVNTITTISQRAYDEIIMTADWGIVRQVEVV